jgi:hypothetical protein
MKEHQTDLFDRQQAQRLKDLGISIALNASHADIWKAKADHWLSFRQTCRDFNPQNLSFNESNKNFTVDDIVQAIGTPSEKANNLIGAWINAKATQGEIQWTGRFVKSKRKTRHAAYIKEWRVL